MWKQIKRAMREGREISVPLPLPDGKAEVRTLEGEPPWTEAMLVQIWVDKPGTAWRQTFGSVEEARQAWEREVKRGECGGGG